MLAICRDWGHDLEWWAGMAADDRALVVADYRIRAREAARGKG